MSIHMFEAIGATGATLKLVANVAVFFFLIWSMYFATNTDFGPIQSVFAFLALGLFSGFVGMFPFGTTFAPILFEWWWHDVPFWDFTMIAWAITMLSMFANILAVLTLRGLHRERY